MQRRLMLLAGAARFTSAIGGVAASVSSRAQSRREVLNEALGAVLKIEADGIAATGFLWPDARHVVTALHVVDHGSRIVVSVVDAQARITDTQVATVERVLQGADLVLLRLQRALPAKPLQLTTQTPDVDQILSALGFPLNIAGHSSTDVRLRFGGRNLRSMLPPKVLAQIKDYPDPNIDVLNLEGNLVPGLSGAPLLDGRGRVCGIADGGLEEGAIGICWGIPAAQLDRLLASDVQRTPKASRLNQLFGADLQASVGQRIGTRASGLVKLRTRSFSQLRSTADDGLGLSQLANLFAVFNPADFSYDVYQNTETGASVALPAGVAVDAGPSFLVAHSPEPGLKLLLRVAPVTTGEQAQEMSVRFERDITGMGQPGVVVQQDPAWSNPTPVRRGSLVVWRRAAMVGQATGGFPQARAYLFEAVATNGRGFLGVAAVNDDVAPATLALEQACMLGSADARCSKVYARRRTWAQMALGVQFSSFAG